MYFIEIESRESKEVVSGVRIRTHWQKQMLMSDVELDPGAVVPDHDHPEEQAGAILEGELEMTIGAEIRTLKPGDTYLIPGGVSHGATAGPNGCRALDVFSPVREDYKY